MALLKIARMGNPVLRAKAAAVDDPTAPWVRQLPTELHAAGVRPLAIQTT